MLSDVIRTLEFLLSRCYQCLPPPSRGNGTGKITSHSANFLHSGFLPTSAISRQLVCLRTSEPCCAHAACFGALFRPRFTLHGCTEITLLASGQPSNWVQRNYLSRWNLINTINTDSLMNFWRPIHCRTSVTCPVLPRMKDSGATFILPGRSSVQYMKVLPLNSEVIRL